MREDDLRELRLRARGLEGLLSSRVFRGGGDRVVGRLAEKVVRRTRAIVGDEAAIHAVPLAEAALQKLLGAVVRTPTEQEYQALVLVLAVWRPVVGTRAGRGLPLDAELSPVFPAWNTFCEAVAPSIRSVGRVQRFDRGRDEWVGVGTGFVVDAGALLTNRHVWWDIRDGDAGVCFGGEDDYNGSILAIQATATLPADPLLDLALLRFDGGSPPALGFEDRAPAAGDAIAVVGFPVKDERSVTAQEAIFGGLPSALGAKRLAPGVLLSAEASRLGHDASTLGGCSGAPVFRQETGRVLGVHYEGEALVGNGAIPAGRVRAFLESL